MIAQHQAINPPGCVEIKGPSFGRKLRSEMIEMYGESLGKRFG